MLFQETEDKIIDKSFNLNRLLHLPMYKFSRFIILLHFSFVLSIIGVLWFLIYWICCSFAPTFRLRYSKNYCSIRATANIRNSMLTITEQGFNATSLLIPDMMISFCLIRSWKDSKIKLKWIWISISRQSFSPHTWNSRQAYRDIQTHSISLLRGTVYKTGACWFEKEIF